MADPKPDHNFKVISYLKKRKRKGCKKQDQIFRSVPDVLV